MLIEFKNKSDILSTITGYQDGIKAATVLMTFLVLLTGKQKFHVPGRERRT